MMFPTKLLSSIEIDHEEVTTTNLLSRGRYYYLIVNRHHLLRLSIVDSAMSAAAADRPFEKK